MSDNDIEKRQLLEEPQVEVDPEQLLNEALRKREELLVNKPEYPILSKEEVQLKIKELKNRFVDVNQAPIDPPIPGQNFIIVSYIPKPLACPECNEVVIPKNGIYGYFKCRGTWSDMDGVDNKIEDTIKNVDRNNYCNVGLVGYWCPVSDQPLSYDVQEKDVREEAEKVIFEKEKAERKKDAQKVKTIKEREKALLEDVEKEIDEEGLDFYIEQRVKLGSLKYYIDQVEDKKKDAIKNLKKVNKLLLEIEDKHPNYANDYKKQYYAKRREAGIPDDAPDPTCLMYSRPQLNKMKADEVEANTDDIKKGIQEQSEVHEEIKESIQEEKD